jgi:hypothetical protein
LLVTVPTRTDQDSGGGDYYGNSVYSETSWHQQQQQQQQQHEPSATDDNDVDYFGEVGNSPQWDDFNNVDVYADDAGKIPVGSGRLNVFAMQLWALKLLGVLKETPRWFFASQMFKKLI